MKNSQSVLADVATPPSVPVVVVASTNTVSPLAPHPQLYCVSKSPRAVLRA
jgi:hypothetical protein